MTTYNRLTLVRNILNRFRQCGSTSTLIRGANFHEGPTLILLRSEKHCQQVLRDHPDTPNVNFFSLEAIVAGLGAAMNGLAPNPLLIDNYVISSLRDEAVVEIIRLQNLITAKNAALVQIQSIAANNL